MPSSITVQIEDADPYVLALAFGLEAPAPDAGPMAERLRALAVVADPLEGRILQDAARLLEAQAELLVRVVREAREDAEGFGIAAEAVEQCMEQVERIVDRVRDRNLALEAELAAVRADWTSERASRARAKLRG